MLIKVLGVSNEIPFCSVSRLCCISCLFYHLSRLLSVGMMTWWWCLAMGVATLLSSCETAVLRHGVQQVFHPSPRNSRQIDLSYPDLSYHPLPTSEYFGPNYVPTTSDDNYGDNIPHPKFLYVANLANAAAVYKTM
ncbi:hypothetical protein Fcan01_21048 [Folsomia candida]|uniref:Uncharacterized protein n=1 Tax=Folsomia candida TaxID=158441 RepID=A0A226DGS9_FOLCA|nr:hypothetical protein Fcan01_21048 [Folsomia candida]